VTLTQRSATVNSHQRKTRGEKHLLSVRLRALARDVSSWFSVLLCDSFLPSFPKLFAYYIVIVFFSACYRPGPPASFLVSYFLLFFIRKLLFLAFILLSFRPAGGSCFALCVNVLNSKLFSRILFLIRQKGTAGGLRVAKVTSRAFLPLISLGSVNFQVTRT
jgi:hypothetical protein